jgi:lysophospholipase L1-like esterase
MKNLLGILLSLLTIFACGSAEDSSPAAASQSLSPSSPDTSYTGKPLNRFDEAILAFETEDQSRTPQSDEVLFIGSSSIRKWKTLAEDLDPIPVLNRGFGGSTLPEVIHYADRIIFPYAPETIVLYCGENDIADGANPDQVFQSFQKLDRMIEEQLPNTDLIYITMKPSPSRWDLWPQYQAGDRQISEYIKNRENRYFIDCSPVMLLPSGVPDSSIFIEDMLHMNAKGYAAWKVMIKPIVLNVSAAN